ncbi:MAG: FliI/YscN family ATPase [Verrucomicrobia bacterium]|nr:FliI/YscN family ATPase [Verrucomicrobiota bacterium]
MNGELWAGDRLSERLRSGRLAQRIGHVVQVTGLVLESDGPNLSLGEVCQVASEPGEEPMFAEVVGFRGHRLLLMPLGEMDKIRVGSEVIATTYATGVPVGNALRGRVLDGLARPIDGKGGFPAMPIVPLRASPPHPLTRQRILDPFSTGVKALDVFTPVGRGQRMGIFSGSGVGKSTLMGMMARGAQSDVNVIALVGERGREVREFLEKDLGEEGLKRSVVVVSTSDQPALVRLRAAFTATAIAEHFRDQGKQVLFMMDSVTRFAMAQREVGLAIGEPPSSRGYTPSVFAMLPKLMERTGAGDTGAITAFYTVLVEGDDMNEPIADAARGILDGHVVLTRQLATSNHFPAIDVLESISRLNRDLCSEPEYLLAARARDLLSTYRKNEDLITIGAYARGSNPKVDQAIERYDSIMGFLRQPMGSKSTRADAWKEIADLV